MNRGISKSLQINKLFYDRSYKVIEKNKTRVKLSFIIYIFCAVFSPPLIENINFIFIVSAFSLYNILTKYKKNINEVIKKSNISKYLFFLMIAIYYIVFIMGINIIVYGDLFFTNYATSIYKMLVLIPMQLICVSYIICRSKELNYSIKEILLAFVLAGIMQSIISIITLIFPNIKEQLINIMAKNTGSDVFYRGNGDKFRYFGFSSSLLDTFGYGTGIIFILSIFLGFYFKTSYLLYAPVLLISPLLNSRTGLMIAGVGFIFCIPVLISKINLSKIIKVTIATIFLLIVFITAFLIINEISPDTIIWISRGFGSINSFLTGTETQYIEVSDILFSNEFWRLPNDWRIIFGTGHTVYGLSEEIGFASDVGYINNIWLGGIIGSLIIYFPIIHMYFYAFKSSNNIMQFCMILFLLISFLLTMVKVDLIGYNSGTIITFTICLFSIYEKNRIK